MRKLTLWTILTMLLSGFVTTSKAQVADFQRLSAGDTASYDGYLVSDSALVEIQNQLAEYVKLERTHAYALEEIDALRRLVEHHEDRAVQEKQWREDALDVMNDQGGSIFDEVVDALPAVAGGYLSCRIFDNGG